MAVGDSAMARVWGTLGNQAGTVPKMWAVPWPRIAGVPLVMPLRIPVWDIWTDAWETWKLEATKQRQTASADELRMCTRLQFPHSLQRSFLPVQAHWRVVVATWHFHVFQRLEAWVRDKLQHPPTFVSNKRPTHIVPRVAGALTILYSDLVGYHTSDIRLLWTIIMKP